MANEAKMVFAASSTTVISLSETISDTYIVGGNTELDNSTDLYPLATAVIEITDTFGGTPSGPINLYMVRGAVDGTSNGTALGYTSIANSGAQTDPEYAEYVGSWNPDVDEAYRDTITISLNGVKKAKFYIKNDTNQTLVYSSNPITVKVHPFTMEPAA